MNPCKLGGGQAVLVVVGPSRALDRLVDLWGVLVNVRRPGVGSVSARNPSRGRAATACRGTGSWLFAAVGNGHPLRPKFYIWPGR